MMVRWALMNMEAYDIGPGDVLLLNDPEYGGGHLPDYCVMRRCLMMRGLICSRRCRRIGDTGGKDPAGLRWRRLYLYRGVSYPC